MSAIISNCGRYRYRLERDIGQKGPIAAIFGVNPSTADATNDDHTIRKEIGFAQRLGWSRIIKGNVFAYRSTDVKVLSQVEDPFGPNNLREVEKILTDADICIVAWGSLAKLPLRLREEWCEIVGLARALDISLHCWGTSKDGHPRHPLMLAYDTPLIKWNAP